MLSRFLNARFVPRSCDVGLLVLRVGIGMILFFKHGWEKLSTISLHHPEFPDLIHIGSTPSWLIAMFSDGICSLLVVIGLGTRWASLFSLCTLFVAWALKHHFAFFGHMQEPGWTIDSVYGEIITELLAAFLALMITGPGRYSVDAMLERRSEAHPDA